MIVEIYGAGFINKGAQFMLWTTIQRLKAADPTIRCAIERRGSYEERAAYRLHTIFPGYPTPGAPLHKRALNKAMRAAAKIAPARALHEYGVVHASQPDALIDVSGYAFGDKWGQKGFKRFLQRAGEYKRRGKPVIMLPQMFGPFEKPGYAELFRQITQTADLIYARDEVSLRHARVAAVDPDRIRIAPDITIFSEVPAPTPREGERHYVCIVPNIRMTDQGKSDWGDGYIDLLVNASKQAAAAGLDVHVILHEASPGDISLGERIVRQVGPDIARMINEPDPVEIKRHIAGAAFIVSSRFHSIVGALSSGVPAITLGWAHKYETILQDFGAPELLCRAEDVELRLPELVGALADPTRRTDYSARFAAAKRSMQVRNASMWAMVIKAVGKR